VDQGIDAQIDRIAGAEADGMRLLLERRADPGGAWFPVTELLESDGAPAVLLSRVRGITEVPADYIRAEWLFESYARVLGELGASFLLAAGRLPDLTPSNLLMASRNGLIAGVAVRSGSLGPPDGDRRELTDSLRSSLVELLEPLVDWFDRHDLRPAKTLWKSAADRIAEATLWAGRAHGESEAASGLTSALLARPGPLNIPLETVVDPRGLERHRRVTCCLAYRAAGGSLCFACPVRK
jgi:hypothetical protein